MSLVCSGISAIIWIPHLQLYRRVIYWDISQVLRCFCLPSNIRRRLTFSHLSCLTLLPHPAFLSPIVSLSPHSSHHLSHRLSFLSIISAPLPAAFSLHFLSLARLLRWLQLYSPSSNSSRKTAVGPAKHSQHLSHLLTVYPSLPRALPEATAYRRLKNTSVSFFGFSRCPNFQTMPSVLWVIQLLNKGKIMVMLQQKTHQINNIFPLVIPCKTLSSLTPICFYVLWGVENVNTQFSQLKMEKGLHLYIVSLLFPHSGCHPQSFSLFCPSVRFFSPRPRRAHPTGCFLLRPAASSC